MRMDFSAARRTASPTRRKRTSLFMLGVLMLQTVSCASAIRGSCLQRSSDEELFEPRGSQIYGEGWSKTGISLVLA